MHTVIIGVLIFISILLIILVLIQNTKSSGGGPMGGGAATQLLGAKRGSDIMERLTWGFALSIMALSLLTTVLVKDLKDTDGDVEEDPNVEAASSKFGAKTKSAPAESEEE